MEKNKTKNQINKELFVVGIGASAGGLDAIQQLFDNMPNDTGMAFIIIQHLSPDFKSLMPELLAKHTDMKIFTAEDKQTIEPNCIYLNQRNKNLHIKGQELYLLDKGPKNNLNLPIDIFFHTLGEEYTDKSIGVILSGTGSDGSRGIKTIKEAGGTIIVQEPSSAQFDGMPNSSIPTNLVDFILPPDKIPDVLIKNSKHKLIFADSDHDKSDDVIFYNILDEVYKISGIDFKLYKRNTLIRRLEKRMNVHNIEDLFDYLIFLKSNAEEKEILKQDFLIGVTCFFRNTEAFESLKSNIIPQLCQSKNDVEPIRVWVPGCSTGEEVYAIAMLLDEHIQTNKYVFDFKIFATDVDSRAINVAGLGSYNINIANEIDKQYLTNYFVKSGDKIQIIKRIREKIVFSNHNILKDPPFIRMDLISCRNLLIYFENKAQARVMQNFQFALNKYGYLFLGHSESLGVVNKLFETVDLKWKLFRNISDTKSIPTHDNIDGVVSTFNYRATEQSALNPAFRFKENPETVFHKYLSKKHSPPSIFIDSNFNILFIKGDAGKQLTHSEGLFEKNLLKIVTPEIGSVIRNGIRRLNEEKKDIIIKDIVNKNEEEFFTFDLIFHKPLESNNLNDVYLIQFGEEKVLDKEKALVIQNLPFDEISKQQFDDIELELKATKTELQTVVEELETSNEELQSSNEELMASNEELQSTNEELQSVNEELYTVNSEFQEKNRELQSVNNDTTNLLNSTQIGTLFLDVDLRIRKFTPALQQHFKLLESDIGRPISSFASNFNESTRDTIISDSKKSLEQLSIIENEIVDLDGNYFLKKVSPFITFDKKINGVVISFIDLNKLKQAEINLDVSETRYRKLFENLNESFAHAKIITDNNGIAVDFEYITVNPAFEKQTGLKIEEIVGKRAFEIFPELKNDPINWIELYSKSAITGEEQFVTTYSDVSKHYYFIHVFSPQENEFAAIFTDITDIKLKEEELQKSEEELKRIQGISNIGSWYFDIATNEEVWTEELYKIYGLDPALKPPTIEEQEKLFTKESWDLLSSSLDTTQQNGNPFELELETIKKDGSKGWVRIMVEVIKDLSGKIIGLRGASQDITKRKELLLHLKYEKQFSQKIADLSPAGIYIYNFDKGTNDYMNNQYERILGYTLEDINAMNSDEFNNLFHPDNRDEIKNHMAMIAAGESQDKIEYRFKHKKGHWVWCFSVDSPFEVDDQGRVISFIGVFIDITEIKDTLNLLTNAKKQAEESDRLKSAFLANMSHEIRTPMNGILGFSELLKTPGLSGEEQSLYLDIIEKSGLRMLNIINDIIDISKIEAGLMKVQLDESNLNDQLNYIATFFKPEVEEKNIQLSYTCTLAEEEAFILTDREKLFAILTNLVKNAIKYSNEGKIEFGYILKNNIENNNQKGKIELEFYVKDSGIGIPNDRHKAIFERFIQADISNKMARQGAGLGLSITKAYIEMLGGKIWVESEEGLGSTFYFTLPYNVVLSKKEKVKDINDLKKQDYQIENLKILIVEDDEISEKLLSININKFSNNIIKAENGFVAIEACRNNPDIDLILMDIQMPGIDGYEATRQIRQFNKEVIIIAQTAFGLSGDMEKSLEVGCNEYITKPIHKPTLESLIEKYFKK